MGDADDLFILCYNKSKLRSIISTIKTWCLEDNLGLNAGKSGIVEFLARKGRKKTLTVGEEYEGIPVCESYKYLGMWVDRKLYMDTQVQQIKKKADWISIKLWSVLKRVSMQYCKNQRWDWSARNFHIAVRKVRKILFHIEKLRKIFFHVLIIYARPARFKF